MPHRSRTSSIPGTVPLTADDIRQACPMVRVDALRPGDVLLTRSSGSEGSAIAAVSLLKGSGFGAKHRALLSTGGYSHAAIWLPVIDDKFLAEPPLFLVESDDYGVGPSLPETVLVRRVGNSATSASFYKLPDGTASAILLRHPGIASIPKDVMRLVVQKLEETDYWKAYSRLSRLSDALDVSPFLRKAAGLALGLVDRSDPKLIAGAFCSELVAKFFSLLDLELFKEVLSPEMVSPNRLVSGSCALSEVENAVLTADLVEDGASGLQMEPLLTALNRPTFLPLLVRNTSSTVNTEAMVSKFFKDQNDDILASSDRMMHNSRSLIALNALAVEQAEALGELHLKQRLVAIGDRLQTAAAMGAMLHEDCRKEAGERLSPVTFGFVLYVARAIESAASDDGTRAMLLTLFRTLRRTWSIIGLRKRLHFWRQRRKLLRQWRSSKRNKGLETQILRSMMLPKGALAELADTLIASAKD